MQNDYAYMSNLAVLNWYHAAEDKRYAHAELKRRGLLRWLEDDGTIDFVLEQCGVGHESE